MSQNYPAPVARLLTLGESPARQHPWPNYLEFGLTPAHIDDLIQMALDDDLNEADGESDEVWAPLHAWRALAQLRAEKAARPLTQLLWRIDENDDDWVSEELPDVFGMIGPAAIKVLQEYLANSVNPMYARIAVADGLGKIAQQHPHARAECVHVLATQLSRFADQSRTLNAFIVSPLLDIKAVEAMDVIKQAFDADQVDLAVQGDFEDVQIEMGVLDKRITPEGRWNWDGERISEEEFQQQQREREQILRNLNVLAQKKNNLNALTQKKKKVKRQQQKKSRKKNRKR